MKKSYLMITAAAALLAACSSNDTFKEVANENVLIGFESNYSGKQTKAEIDINWFKTVDNSFGVYGWKHKETSSDPQTVPLFSNERVKFDGTVTPNDWTHTTVRYWDKSLVADNVNQNGYYFYAYAPYSENAVSFVRAAESPATTGFNYNLGTQVVADASQAATVDLCVARVENTDYTQCHSHSNTITTYAGHVSFVFNHVLSKLAFKVKSEGFENTYTVTLKELKVAFPSASNVKWTQTAKNADAGSISYDNNSSESTLQQPDDNTTKTIVYSDNTGQTVTTSGLAITNAKQYIVTPNILPAGQANSQKHNMLLEVKYEINYNDDANNPTIETQIATGSASINFVQNYFYYLVVNIKPAKIEFDVESVQGFTPAADETVDVQ